MVKIKLPRFTVQIEELDGDGAVARYMDGNTEVGRVDAAIVDGDSVFDASTTLPDHPAIAGSAEVWERLIESQLEQYERRLPDGMLPYKVLVMYYTRRNLMAKLRESRKPS